MMAKLIASIGLKGGAIIALVLVLAFMTARAEIRGSRLDKVKTELAAVEAERDVLKLDLELKERASLERAADNADLSDQEEELRNARTHEGDDAATRRLRALCVKLWQQDADRFRATAACRRLVGEDRTGDPG